MITHTYTDPYNIAYFYLLNKYGYARKELTNKQLSKRLLLANKRDRKEIEKEIKDSDYMYILKEPTEEKDILIKTLLSQYSLSFKIKSELENTLKAYNIM